MPQFSHLESTFDISCFLVCVRQKPSPNSCNSFPPPQTLNKPPGVCDFQSVSVLESVYGNRRDGHKEQREALTAVNSEGNKDIPPANLLMMLKTSTKPLPDSSETLLENGWYRAWCSASKTYLWKHLIPLCE